MKTQFDYLLLSFCRALGTALKIASSRGDVIIVDWSETAGEHAGGWHITQQDGS